ncbi:hypothetical protein IW142_003136 [Coemansia sp. RSA 564]|nr:hypothetical protein IW142_003136 [Coemansia sp. RSA 564]KAJ2240746.1 hypothetical protein GGH97_004551 [Coemansia sp. RSA 475]KAJ2407608.1 hypothetical protein J3F80_002698 [Coemansia sp. RSA 2526]
MSSCRLVCVDRALKLRQAARHASVLAHSPNMFAEFAVADQQHLPVIMDPLQYILQQNKPVAASGARRLATAIAAQNQQQTKQQKCKPESLGTPTPRILSIERQPHSRTIEVEMSALDLQKLLQRGSARHYRCPPAKHAQTANKDNANKGFGTCSHNVAITNKEADSGDHSAAIARKSYAGAGWAAALTALLGAGVIMELASEQFL